MPSYYDVLGVSEGAGEAEIAEAYRELAKLFHPDQHPGVSPAERAQYEQAMARINEAYNVLKDSPRRAEYASGLRAENVRARPDDTRHRPPRSDECTLCGCSPAAPFRFEHQHAWVIFATRFTNDATLCRDCAQSLGRAAQNRTLLAGWYGVRSIFRNIAVVWRNAVALRRAHQLTEPRRAAEVVSPLARPLAPGRVLFGRLGVYFSAFLLVVGLGFAAASDDEPSTPQRSSPNADLLDFDAPSWGVGACLTQSGSYFTPIECSPGRHYARVIAERQSEALCPQTANYSVADGAVVYCILGL